MSRRRDFTLVEVLVCLAIGSGIATLATVTFMRMRATLRRVEARLAMHNTARFVHQQLRTELAAMQQDAALWLISKKDGGTGDGEVRLVFLRGKVDTTDFSHDLEYGAYTTLNTDLLWSQWAWKQERSVLCTGASATVRMWTMGPSWVGPNGKDYAGRPFRNMPQPRREARLDYQTRLDDNKWGSPDPQDMGDWTDLDARTLPTTRDVTAFRFEVVLADGTVEVADGSQDKVIPLDGTYVDGRVPASSAPSKRRPRLVRVRFTLTDKEVGLTQAFAFSVPTCDMLPQP